MKKILFLTGLISLSVMSFGQRANKGTISINTVELDPIYTTDSPNLLWWNDTVPKIATRYDLTNYEPKITPGTAWDYIRGDKTLRQLNTGAVVESTNQYFTNARARSAFSLTTNGTSGAATYDPATGAWNIPNYASLSYTLPLAENGIRGGIQIGYVSSANNFALQLSSEKGYVALPNASSTIKGLSTFSSTNFTTSFGYVTIANAGISYNHLANQTISGLLAINSGITDTDEMMLSYGGMLKKTRVSVLGDYMQTYLGLSSLSSKWTFDPDGITTAYNAGIGTASSSFYKLLVGGHLKTHGVIHANEYIESETFMTAQYFTALTNYTSFTAQTTAGGIFFVKNNLPYFQSNYANGNIQYALSNAVEPFRSISANTTLAVNDKIVLVTTGGITITYPTVPAGKVYTIKNSTSTTITVPTYTIFGPSGSNSIAAYACVTVFYSGSGWFQMD